MPSLSIIAASPAANARAVPKLQLYVTFKAWLLDFDEAANVAIDSAQASGLAEAAVVEIAEDACWAMQFRSTSLGICVDEYCHDCDRVHVPGEGL